MQSELTALSALPPQILRCRLARPHPARLPAALVLRLVLLGCLLQAGCVTSQSELSPGTAPPNRVKITSAQAAAVGQKIWNNECGGTVPGLTSWNRGEDFASLGIGHFIWYVPGRRGPFEESFPALVDYVKSRGARPPEVAEAKGCPWKSYDEFHAAKNSGRMRDLRSFLVDTVPLQTEFLIRRLENALPKMRRSLSFEQDRARVTKRFYAVAESPRGLYALIDYVNFKGEGTAPSERYRNQGWGLLQVLEEMKGDPRGTEAAREFSASAKRVLQRRVRNSPPARNESRWLPGWMKRCESYARPL